MARVQHTGIVVGITAATAQRAYSYLGLGQSTYLFRLFPMPPDMTYFSFEIGPGADYDVDIVKLGFTDGKLMEVVYDDTIPPGSQNNMPILSIQYPSSRIWP